MKLLLYSLTSHKLPDGTVVKNCQVICEVDGHYYFNNVVFNDHPEEALWTAILGLPDIIARGPVN